MEDTRRRNLVVGIVLALLALGFALDRVGYVTPARIVLQSVLQPTQAVLSGIGYRIGEIGQPRQTVEHLQAENLALQEEVNRLVVENIQLRELERENQRLRELLNYTRNNPNFDYTTAGVIGQIIGTDPSNLLYTVFINVGARDGIARDMPVITHRGLAGRVVQVGPNYARVLLMIDPTSSVNVVIQNSRVQGIVRGALDGTLIMERIPQGETVSPGDLVLTSGLGGNFPDKLVVGQVIEVFQRDLDLFQTARVRSTVDFGDLETVLVLTAFQPVDFESDLDAEAEVED